MVLFIDTHLNDVVIILYKNGKIIKKRGTHIAPRTELIKLKMKGTIGHWSKVITFP